MEKVYAGWSEEGLIEEGISQANRLGKEMQGWGISTIYTYTSPIRRALQTARILNTYLNTKLVIEPDLIEMKMGLWEGLSEDEVVTRYPFEYKIWLERPAELKLNGRETLDEIQQRAVRAINRILEQQPDTISLVVTHVALIRCLFLYFNRLHLNSYKAIDVSNTSIYQFN
ncbi:MAG: Phosphoserine phosphatase 1 [candidate division WS2 bacterium]|nr:Phosphoserine phosphatase 1 [Candidatus Lithacetigena glycinireducens]